MAALEEKEEKEDHPLEDEDDHPLDPTDSFLGLVNDLVRPLDVVSLQASELTPVDSIWWVSFAA